jgi:hypothetical protein
VKKILLLSMVIMLLCWSLGSAVTLTTAAKHNSPARIDISANNSGSHVATAVAGINRHSTASSPAIAGRKAASNNRVCDSRLLSQSQPISSDGMPLAVSPKYKGSAKLQKVDVVPPPPDEQTILQGGDTFASATNITSLPYTDNGTTTGYAHNYTLPCLTNNTSPDVVYKYTPSVNGTIVASLCGSTFDTGLGVYKDSYSIPNLIA